MSKGLKIALIVVGIIVLIGFMTFSWFLKGYNNVIAMDENIKGKWAQVENQLKRRYDLIPNLIETVKGYASHERETFETVVRARAAAQEAGTVEQQAEAEDFLTGALRKLFALAEDYPELRASENFRSLQADLSDTENKISVARQIYNDTTLSYNNAVQTVPSNLIAGMFRFATREYFEVENDARSAPEVSF